MASSTDGDKDKPATSNDKQSNPANPANPFIQFRQFADTQISSLLQDIIGLPSAFQKRSTDPRRWAGIDDGLRRRDEIQARQKELKESEDMKDRMASDEEGTLAQTTDRVSFPNGDYQPLSKRQDKYGVKDLPLYSAVTKSLFAHLRQPDFDEADWNDLETPPLYADLWGGKGFLTAFFPLKLREDQLSARCDESILKLTHYMVYNELNTSGRLRSKYSLLPYLIFSPYSPLRLDTDHPYKDRFYCDAFEDLLRISKHGAEEPKRKDLTTRMMGPRQDSPQGNMRWIDHLHTVGLLQESQARFMKANPQSPEAASEDRGSTNSPGSPSPPRSTEDWMAVKDRDGQTGVAKTLRTEQEMYDHFLNWASSPQAIKDLTQAGESFLASFENSGPLGKMKGQDRDDPGPPSLIKEILEVTKAFRELAQANDTPSKVPQDERLPRETNTDSPDRVVSSSTTTEQTVHEDGTVETSITVWKKFGSGRETSTETHHCEDPAVPPANSHPGEQRDSENVAKENVKPMKKEKSGWFWN